MECNKDEALRAKSIAEDKFERNDFVGAKKFASKAQGLYPGLDGTSQMLSALNVYVSAEKKLGGEMDWYGVLGVGPSADEETMRKQYKRLALSLHPDKNGFAGTVGAFRLVSDAWSLLSDKAKRSAYDHRRTASKPKPTPKKQSSGPKEQSSAAKETSPPSGSSRPQSSAPPPPPRRQEKGGGVRDGNCHEQSRKGSKKSSEQPPKKKEVPPQCACGIKLERLYAIIVELEMLLERILGELKAFDESQGSKRRKVDVNSSKSKKGT